VSDLARHSSTQVVVESYGEVGFNYRMTDLQAAIGLPQLHRLDDMIVRRRLLASRYTQKLSEWGWLVPPQEPASCQHNFQSYMVRLTDEAPVSRDQLMQELLDQGISTRRGVMAIHRERPYRDAQWDARLPETNLVTDTTIILPLFHDMTEDQQDHVITCLEQVGCMVTR